MGANGYLMRGQGESVEICPTINSWMVSMTNETYPPIETIQTPDNLIEEEKMIPFLWLDGIGVRKYRTKFNPAKWEGAQKL
jgi:hypothetical protein